MDGSPGGMYAAWMRMKYPHVLDGAIAASAPIWSFMGEVINFIVFTFFPPKPTRVSALSLATTVLRQSIMQRENSRGPHKGHITSIHLLMAPHLSCVLQDPPYTPNGFAQVVTRDCKPEAGASEACLPNLKNTWGTLLELAETAEGILQVASQSRLYLLLLLSSVLSTLYHFLVGSQIVADLS